MVVDVQENFIIFSHESVELPPKKAAANKLSREQGHLMKRGICGVDDVLK